MKAREIHRRHFQSSVGSVLNEHYDSGAVTPTALSSNNGLRQSTFPISSSRLFDGKSTNFINKPTESCKTLSLLNAFSTSHPCVTPFRNSVQRSAEETNQMVSQIATKARPLEMNPKDMKLEDERRDRMTVSGFATSQPCLRGFSDSLRKPISNSDSMENISSCGSRNPHTLYSYQSLARDIGEQETHTCPASSKHMGSNQKCWTPPAEGDLLKRVSVSSSSPHNLEDVPNQCILSGVPGGARSNLNETSRPKYAKHRNMNMRSSFVGNRGASSVNLLASTGKKDPKSSTTANKNDRDSRAYIDWDKIFPHPSRSSTEEHIQSANSVSRNLEPLSRAKPLKKQGLNSV